MRKGHGEYPEGWKEFANKLKDEAGWKCVRCGNPHDPANGYCLTVHHLTMNKAEPFDHWWAFVVLCQRCHLHIQSKVDMRQAWFLPHSTWFLPYVCGYYASRLGYPTDKDWVLANIDDILFKASIFGVTK
jgi:hypothetical protein